MWSSWQQFSSKIAVRLLKRKTWQCFIVFKKDRVTAARTRCRVRFLCSIKCESGVYHKRVTFNHHNICSEPSMNHWKKTLIMATQCHSARICYERITFKWELSCLLNYVCWDNCMLKSASWYSSYLSWHRIHSMMIYHLRLTRLVYWCWWTADLASTLLGPSGQWICHMRNH